MRVTKQLEKLFNRIIDAQIAYHITGGEWDNTLYETHETKNGMTITYIAKRNFHSARGLSYTVTKIEVSIQKGYKETLLGITHEFGREKISFI